MSEPRPNADELSETAKIPASNNLLDLFPLGDTQYDAKYDTEDEPKPVNLLAKPFPNLVRREVTDLILDQNDAILMAELTAAGIPGHIWQWADTRLEVPTRVLAGLCRWKFKRSWRYWVASGPGLPLEFADRLYQRVGTVCRVDGHGCGPDPRRYLGGFACDLYHVDTPEGLRELADTLKEIVRQAGFPITNGYGKTIEQETTDGR